MADKIYNISTSEGETFSVPAWAKEETLSKLLKTVQQNVDVNKQVVDEVLNLDNDIDDIVGILTQSLEDQYKTKKNEAEEDTEKSKYFKEVGASIKDTFDSNNAVDFLKNSANMFNTGIFKPAGKKANGFLTGKFPKIMGGIAKFAGPLGMAAQLASDALFAYAGLLVAAYGQQAKLSSSLINVGGIIDGTSVTMKDLQDRVLGSAMSLEQFGKLVENFGPTVAGLGENVSGGIIPLVNMLDNLHEVSKEYGAFGMGIEERNTEFMTFLENKRLSGALDGGIQGKTQSLVNEFALMQAEITSLATLTGQARSDIFAQRMAAMSEPETAAIREGLDRLGNEGQRQVFETLVSQTSQIEQALGEAAAPATTLMAATKDAILRANYDMENVNILSSLKDMAPGLATLFADDIVEYQNLITSGNVEAANGFLFDMFQEMEGIDVAYGIGGNELSDAQKQLNVFQTRMSQFLNQVANETEEERKARLDARDKEIKDKMAATGAFQVASNTMEELKKEVASMLIPNLQGLARGAADFLEGLKDFISWLNPFDDPDEEITQSDGSTTTESLDSLKVTSDYNYTPGGNRGDQDVDVDDPRNAPVNIDQVSDDVSEAINDEASAVNAENQQVSRTESEAARRDLNDPSIRGRMTDEERAEAERKAEQNKPETQPKENKQEVSSSTQRNFNITDEMRNSDEWKKFFKPRSDSYRSQEAARTRADMMFRNEITQGNIKLSDFSDAPRVEVTEPPVAPIPDSITSVVPKQDVNEEENTRKMLDYFDSIINEQDAKINTLTEEQIAMTEQEILRTRAWNKATKTLMRNNRTA